MFEIKKRIRVVLLVLMSVLLLSTSLAVASNGVDIGSKAPEFDLIDNFDAKTLSSQALRDRVVVLIFSTRKATPKANEWHLAIEQRYKEYEEREELAVATIAILKGIPFFISNNKVKQIMKKESKTPLFMDWKGKITDAFGVSSKKASIVLIDKDWVIQDYQEEFSPELMKRIETCLK